MEPDFEAEFAAHRAALLRHCYRMLGSFAEAEELTQDTLERGWKGRATYTGAAPLQHWLHAIATNACLNALSQRQRRALPQLEQGPAAEDVELVRTEPERWLTPAADARSFPDPSEIAESRETVALAFVALLQRVPPRQRAALLLKDVVGWSAEEISEALGLSVSAVNSALHRGRETVARNEPRAEEPSAETLSAFVRAWETRDLDALVGLLRNDVTLAMPPYAAWFHGVEAVTRFFRTRQFWTFWSSVGRVALTRANARPALGFYRTLGDGTLGGHALMVVRFQAGQVAEMNTFVGAHYFAGFELSGEPTA